jgi:caffeoyl-CoA O-methyltransferase
MKSFSAESTEKLADYLKSTFRPDDESLKEIRTRAKESRLPDIHVGEMDGLHLEVLTRASGAKKVVEIGTLAGYSGVCLLRGMGTGGMLYTFDADHRHTEIALESFAKAGFSKQVKAFVGPAIQNLSKIENEGPFDLVFVDADKAGYPDYLRWAADHLKVGGLLIGDNTLAWGMITDTKFEDPEDEQAVGALRQFNQEAAQNGRFRATLLPTGEGLTVAVKIR